MIQALQLKNQLFTTNIIQGPLAGVSCAPFRRLTWKYSQPAFSCTEMISCKTLLHHSKALAQRFVNIAPDEGPVCFQLAGNNPSEIAEATKRVTDYGASLIDLNCGCPVNKIRRKGAGSALLIHPAKLYLLIQALKQHTHLPVSIKIRVDGNSQDKLNLGIAKVVSESGIDFLIVHGRHWTEQYETPCHYAQIQYFVETLKIPVIGNGDIRCVESLKKMFATGCAGVMISRAGMGQPWLIRKLINEMQQKEFSLPSLSEIGLIFIEHIEQLILLLNNEKFALLQARKFAKYYAREINNKTAFFSAINSCDNFSNFKDICLQYFKEDNDDGMTK